jgi:sigma-B regulation protein RsbU (phosphoserine phosphatase)
MGVAVGDVSDKGVPAAIFMAMTRSLMRAEARRAETPREALMGVNRHLLEMNDAGMFVTVVYGILNRVTRSFAYARAGHELPVCCAPDGSVHAPRGGLGQALGVFPEPALDEQSLVLSPGGTLIIYTDGMTDATDSEGERFGTERFYELLHSSGGSSAQTLCDHLMDIALGFQGGVAQHDDITLVAIRALEGM